MRLPIRTHSVGRAAPTPLGPSWSPSTLTNVSTSVGTLKVPKHLLRIPKVPNPAIIIGWYVAEQLLKEAGKYIYLYMNGLTYNYSCRLGSWDSFGTVPDSIQCLHLQHGPSTHLRHLGPMVQNANAGDRFHMLGAAIPHWAGGTGGRWATTSVWSATGGRRRPFWSSTGLNQVGINYSYRSKVLPVGQNPAVTRPYPVWAGANPYVRADPAPTPAYPTEPAYGHAPQLGLINWEWVFDGPRVDNPPTDSTAPPRNPPISRPLPRTASATRVVANSMTREVKFGANTAFSRTFFLFMKAREEVSEWEDFIEVLYKSLPRMIRRQYGGDDPTLFDQVSALALWGDQIDVKLALRNLIANQIEDELIGQTWFKARGALRDALFGNHVGSTGPVANPMFQEYSKQVSALANKLANMLTNTADIRAAHHNDRTIRELYKKLQRDLDRLTGDEIYNLVRRANNGS